MKKDSMQILEELKLKIDKENLQNLIEFSEKKYNPLKYNENIIKYQDYIAVYTGIRMLKSPFETFNDFLILLKFLINLLKQVFKKITLQLWQISK